MKKILLYIKEHGRDLSKAFSPNFTMKKTPYLIMVFIQIVAAYYFWISSSSVIPKPLDVIKSIPVVLSEGMLPDLWISTKLAFHAILVSLIITSVIIYGSVLSFFKPISFLFTKLRYMTSMGLSFVFTILTGGGYDLKLCLMVYGVTVFFITTMSQNVKDISPDDYKYARSLRMNEWRVSLYTVIWGKLEALMEALRQNFAICWMTLTMVEGLVRTDGGIGVMLLNENKHMKLDKIFAIQLILLSVGILGDYAFAKLKYLVCPHTKPTLKQR